METLISVIGGANVDLSATLADAFIAADSNPGHIDIGYGGVARNIAHNLSLLGARTQLLTIFGGDLFAYRDAGYYHYPFARQIESRLAAGELPLWDPYENLGVPLAGNPAAAVFYPVRAAVFAAVGRGVPFNAAYKFYVLVHLAVAFGAAVALACLALTALVPFIFARVFSPTLPSAVRPLAFWNAFTASSVAGPKSPSADPL